MLRAAKRYVDGRLAFSQSFVHPALTTSVHPLNYAINSIASHAARYLTNAIQLPLSGSAAIAWPHEDCELCILDANDRCPARSAAVDGGAVRTGRLSWATQRGLGAVIESRDASLTAQL